MDEHEFEQLLASVREMGRQLRGETVAGLRVSEWSEPDVRSIRAATQLSQTKFAALIGVRLRTLQAWENRRSRPIGPARALLRIVERDPQALIALRAELPARHPV